MVFAANFNTNRFLRGFQYDTGIIEDPTYLGFSLFVPRTEAQPGNSILDEYIQYSPLFNESQYGESAYRYLMNIGEPSRAEALKEFKKLFYALIYDYPHLLTEVSGLKEILKTEYLEKGSPRGGDITIKTFETLDLIIARLAQLWKYFSYDTRNFKEILPKNLRWFNITLFFSDVRKFHTSSGNAVTNNGSSKWDILENPNIGIITDKIPPLARTGANLLKKKPGGGNDNSHLTGTDELISIMSIVLSRCEFDFNSSNAFIDTIDTSPEKEADNSFIIKANHVVERDYFKLGSLFLDTWNTADTLIGSDKNIESIVGFVSPTNEYALKNMESRNAENSKPENLTGKLKQLGSDIIKSGPVTTLGDQAKNYAKNQLQSILAGGNNAYGDEQLAQAELRSLKAIVPPGSLGNAYGG